MQPVEESQPRQLAWLAGCLLEQGRLCLLWLLCAVRRQGRSQHGPTPPAGGRLSLGSSSHRQGEQRSCSSDDDEACCSQALEQCAAAALLGSGPSQLTAPSTGPQPPGAFAPTAQRAPRAAGALVTSSASPQLTAAHCKERAHHQGAREHAGWLARETARARASAGRGAAPLKARALKLLNLRFTSTLLSFTSP